MGWLNVLGLWVNLVGLGLQVAGALVAVAGLRRTWRAYSEGRGFTSALLAPVLTGGPVLRLRRLLGWHPSPIAMAGHAQATASVDSATLRVTPRALPPGDVLGQLAELDRRTLVLYDMVDSVADRHAADVAALQRSLADLGAAQAAVAAALAIKVREAAIGGVLVAARGLALVALGLVLQLLAAPALDTDRRQPVRGHTTAMPGWD